MNEENKEDLMADIIIDEKTNSIIAYKIKDEMYVFANHKINTFVRKIDDAKKCINVRRTINIIYIYDEKTKEKSRIGLYLNNNLYTKEGCDLATLGSNQLYKALGCLIIKQSMLLQPEEGLVVRFNYILYNRTCAIKKERSKRQAVEKQERHVKYNKKNTYKLKIVLDLLGIGIEKFILDDEEFFAAKRFIGVSKIKDAKLNVDSKIKTKAWIYNGNVMGVVFYDKIFTRLSCWDKDNNNSMPENELSSKIKIRVVCIEDEGRCPIIVEEEPSTETAPEETIALLQFLPANTQSAQAPPTETIELAQILPAETSSTTHDTPHSTSSEITFAEPKLLTTTRFTNSSAESLSKVNNKYCKCSIL